MIKCRNASYGYEGKPVISELNFEVSGGDYLCVVGENGSGKSTLVKGLLRLKSPMDGEYSCTVKSSEIGYLPQQSETQKDFPASVYEVVVSGVLNKIGHRLFYNSDDKKTALKNMDKMGIADIKAKSYHELSGGQQQRVLLARALCAADKLLILDEPVAGLDPIVTAEMYGLIKQINKDGMTIIMVSHDIEQAASDASHILHLGQKQMFFGKTSDYLKTTLGRCYVGGKSGE